MYTTIFLNNMNFNLTMIHLSASQPMAKYMYWVFGPRSRPIVFLFDQNLKFSQQKQLELKETRGTDQVTITSCWT